MSIPLGLPGLERVGVVARLLDHPGQGVASALLDGVDDGGQQTLP